MFLERCSPAPGIAAVVRAVVAPVLGRMRAERATQQQAARARWLAVGLAMVASALWVASASAASPGDLDTSYGLGTGASRVNFGFNEVGTGIALEPDGRIVVVGHQVGGAVQWVQVAVRLMNPDGTLDPSFGGGTGQAVPWPATSLNTSGMLIQPDGAIVIAATDYSSADLDMFITRLVVADGSPDLSYGLGTGGSQLNYGLNEGASAIALAPDGKLVVGGYGSTAGDPGDLLVARVLNPQGTVDTSYGAGTGGSRPPLAGSQTGRAVAVQPNGQILVAGDTTPPMGVPDFIVARFLNPDGTNDPSFGAGASYATVDFGGSDAGEAMVLQPDGKILLAGTTSASGTPDFAVARLNGDGSPDDTFGQGGKEIIDLGANDYAHAVALQPDGKIVIAGETLSGAAGDIAVVRLQPNGLLDSTFGNGGKSIVDLGENERASGIALQADGKILLGGTSVDAIGRSSILAVRLLGDPSPTGSAGGTGGSSGQGGAAGTAPATGGSGTATQLCDGRRATIIGTAAADKLTGTTKADVIVSLGGNDTIKGGGGNDVICTGDGDDHVDGGSGNDRAFGQAGNDTLTGSAGADELSGQAGNDTMAAAWAPTSCRARPATTRSAAARAAT